MSCRAVCCGNNCSLCFKTNGIVWYFVPRILFVFLFSLKFALNCVCIDLLHWLYIALSLYCIELYIHILHWIYIALSCIHIILHWIVHRNCIELYTNIELNYIQILHWVEYIEFNRIQILHWIVYKYCIELYTYCIELSHIALNCHILHWIVTYCIELSHFALNCKLHWIEYMHCIIFHWFVVLHWIVDIYW